MLKPTLKQAGDLNLNDFEQHPIWLNVHGIDDSEPWYEETDEVTYRPWDRSFPYDRRSAASPRVLVRSDFQFADGTKAVGSLYPMTLPNGDLRSPSYTQPQIFIPGGGRMLSFYWPIRRLVVNEQQRLHEWLRRDSSSLFPLRFSVSETLVTPSISGELLGFYYLDGSREVIL